MCFHPTVRTYVWMYDLLAHVVSRLFSSSIFSLRVCWKNLQKITKLLLELWRFSATAQGVVRPAVAIAGSSDVPRRTWSFWESISEWNGPFYLHHFAWSKALFVRNAAKHALRMSDNTILTSEKLEPIRCRGDVACRLCFLPMQPHLPSTEITFFFLPLWGACPPHLFLLLCIYFTVLSSCHARPWITTHFEKIDIECQTFQALEKCIYLPPVSQVWRRLWPMWLWRVSDREGLSWKPWALFDVPGMQMLPGQRILRPDQLQPWLEWSIRRSKTAKGLFHYRKWPFCSHPLASDPCVSFSFTKDWL